MKLATLTAVFVCLATAACMEQPMPAASPVGSASLTSATICPADKIADENGNCMTETQMENYDMP